MRRGESGVPLGQANIFMMVMAKNMAKAVDLTLVQPPLQTPSQDVMKEFSNIPVENLLEDLITPNEEINTVEYITMNAWHKLRMHQSV